MKSFPVKEGVPGFLAGGIAAGIKKTGAKDLALLVSTTPCVAAGAFTKNRVKAAPVMLCKKRVQQGLIQAILVNSGNANACTGRQGIEDARLVCEEAASQLGIKKNLIVPCSTGVIGMPLPIATISSHIPLLVKSVSPEGIADFAEAILTTDTCSKIAGRQDTIQGDIIKVCGIAKGSGMIMPQMATMLAFVITNATITKELLDKLLIKTVDETFNRITVDGETSTNDTVLVLANGLSKAPIDREASEAYKKFAALLHDVMGELAGHIVRDGEGATKLVTIKVIHAKRIDDAKKAAFRVANSNLFKTACFGGDYNWGRIMAALGNSGASFNPDRTEIVINGITGVKDGRQVAANIDKLKKTFKKKEIHITVDLHDGGEFFDVKTCDLSYEYVKINASYTT